MRQTYGITLYILAEMSMKISTLKIQNLIKRINDPSTIKKKLPCHWNIDVYEILKW